MSREFKLHRRFYDDEYELYHRATMQFNPGVTVLVGCNGSGKTTLLRYMKEKLEAQKIPVVHFDNLSDGGAAARSKAGFLGDMTFLATAFTASEGENIIMNIGQIASSLRPFIKTGKRREDKLAEAFASALHSTDAKEIEVPKERWILFDAIDSGLSVDNIVAVKEQLFQAVIADRGDCDVYIIVSANEYELARGEQCFDVYNGKYITFKDYEDYRKFILHSGDIKSKRYDE